MAHAKINEQVSTKVRPSDVFNGETVRRRYFEQVMDLVVRNAISRKTFISGNMITSSEGYEWILPGGRACLTPAFWGQPRSFYVSGEEARANILLAMKIDLSRSRSYKQYKP